MPVASKKRTRTLPFTGWSGLARITYSWQPGREDLVPLTGRQINKASQLQGIEITQSENHPQWRKIHSFTGGDVGGDFFNLKKYVSPASPLIVDLYGTEDFSPPVGRFSTTHYNGPLLPIGPSQMPFPNASNSGNTTLDAWGTKAIAICKPTNSVASAAQALIELYHDGVPKVIGAEFWKDHTRAARKAGSEYLNYEFGWVPLANDIASFAAAVVDFDRIAAQYERDSGKLVRRRYNFPPEKSESMVTVANNVSVYVDPSVAGIVIPHFSATGKVVRIRKSETRRWFSGAFTYYLPDDYFARKETKRTATLAEKLLGLELTPELIWNVTPWSWAVDWFSSVGDVISNFSDWASDGLVLQYGYIMEHIKVSDDYVFVGPTGLQNQVIRPQVITVVTETKVRRKATPFGFGLLLSSLTARQKAIMIALGLTK